MQRVIEEQKVEVSYTISHALSSLQWLVDWYKLILPSSFLPFRLSHLFADNNKKCCYCWPTTNGSIHHHHHQFTINRVSMQQFPVQYVNVYNIGIILLFGTTCVRTTSFQYHCKFTYVSPSCYLML